jgi:hypothetical protein
MTLQVRTIPAEGLEVRAGEDGKQKTLTGYGIVYNRETHLWRDMYEVIRPGAASEFLKTNPDIKCALNHRPSNYLFGRTKSGTMKIEEDERGVKYTTIPPDAQWAKDAMASIERGDIDGSSFTFSVKPQDEKLTQRDDGTFLREIFKFSRIGEMGPVTDPAYLDTTAEARAKAEYDSLTAPLRTQGDAEKIAETKRTLDLRKRKLNLQSKS